MQTDDQDHIPDLEADLEAKRVELLEGLARVAQWLRDDESLCMT